MTARGRVQYPRARAQHMTGVLEGKGATSISAMDVAAVWCKSDRRKPLRSFQRLSQVASVMLDETVFADRP
jgi:hypothetical protein